ncbi:MAG: hypothetical protein ACR2OD_03360, partial [Gaiellaceae bacterium]
DLVLPYKYMLTLLGDSDYERNLNASDELSPSQKRFAEVQLHQFRDWWEGWPGQSYAVASEGVAAR